ncbi:nucleotide exchange factor GrpE [archaeon]|nr:nucleotide exchange factor GrpE [archaeon]
MTKENKKDNNEKIKDNTTKTTEKNTEDKTKTTTKEPTELEKQTKKVQEYENTLKRLQAEFDNYRKRTEKEKIDSITYANEKIIISLLDILDNFERAMDEMKKTEETEKLKTGVELIFKQLYQLLKTQGVQKIEAIEQQFDPKKHEALMQIVSDKHKEDTVIQVMQKGYMIKEKVIRPTKVAVSKKSDNDKKGD